MYICMYVYMYVYMRFYIINILIGDFVRNERSSIRKVLVILF